MLDSFSLIFVSCQTHFFVGGGRAGHGKLVKPYNQMTLEKFLGIRDQSCPMLRLSYKAMW